jgi:hypothetical protein
MIPAEIRALVQEWEIHPYDINDGHCGRFVRELADRTEKYLSVLTTSDYVDQDTPAPKHYWVSDGDLHYDAEEPEGVYDWRELPIFRRSGFFVHKLMDDDFKEVLRRSGLVRVQFDKAKAQKREESPDSEGLNMFDIAEVLHTSVVALQQEHTSIRNRLTELHHKKASSEEFDEPISHRKS